MLRIWDQFTVKIGGKSLFDYVRAKKLERYLRAFALGVMDTDKEAALGMVRIKGMGRLELHVWARHRPPWWAGKFLRGIQDRLARMGEGERPGDVRVLFTSSQTPGNPILEDRFPAQGRRICAWEPDWETIEVAVQGRELAKHGLQVDNGLVVFQDGDVLTLERRHYVCAHRDAERAINHSRTWRDR